MKWFIKALRHYADFSKRARRREYWMFVLFNLLFLIGLTMLVSLLVKDLDDESLPSVIYSCWIGITGLPALAVTVRRLHDVGKSGWWMLTGLIPLVGGIWLLVLVATNGQQGENKYGSDPKTSPEVFPDRAKLKSVGIALTVGGSFAVLSALMQLPKQFASEYYVIAQLVATVLMLVAGSLFLRCREREQARSALKVLIAGAGIFFMMNVINMANVGMLIEHGAWLPMVNISLGMLLYLSVALFSIFLLFAGYNENMIRVTGRAIILLVCISILFHIVSRFWMWARIDRTQLFGFLAEAAVIALILVAWTYLSKKEVQPARELSAGDAGLQDADAKAVYNPSAGDASLPQPRGGLGWKIFGLVVSIGLIAGGLSGEMVLRGTESSEALIVVGVLFLIGDIVAIVMHFQNGTKKEEYEEQLASGEIHSVELASPATIRVVRDSSLVGAIVPYKVYLNHTFIGKIDNGKTLDISTHVSYNIITVFDNLDNAFRGDFTTNLEAGGYAEVHVKAGHFVK